MSYSADHLANQFLIAMPGMVDPNFAGSVIYLFEHTERGAMGLVINRPTELDMGALFEKIEVKLEAEPVSEQPVYFGGPVQIERGFVLHEPTEEVAYSSSLAVLGGLTMTTSKDVLEAVATGSGPSKFLMTLGYAGWSAGQLEEEITLNGWMNVPLSQKQMVEIIFDTPSSQRYDRTMSLLGFDPSHLSGEAGHA
ncbi:YqgE/AlgH family protein [Polynucleobacter sp. AP-Elch-400A-B2]|uniref:YqgE/AlgH family protein n=1 Tax=Polynucleobacter sp. AP-Elch-400A-B2 TaxID=2576930 RepID=UPI001BFECFB2|nr:YqgE/AlgH family protein [Polynucleobacter sp. AP-Elch-400A-B2]QWE25686.1 YqgE/AlgH family protein [Polynucleobacter sp. AP-Elch-400A-B2]